MTENNFSSPIADVREHLVEVKRHMAAMGHRLDDGIMPDSLSRAIIADDIHRLETSILLSELTELENAGTKKVG